MDRNTMLWALVLFFGASIAFSAIRRATDGESIAVTLGLELAALAAIVAGVVIFVRRRR
jgi:uncharacterized membrane protein YwaF